MSDCFFLPRFYSHPDPWTGLTAIHASVQRDFAPARELGLTLGRADA